MTGVESGVESMMYRSRMNNSPVLQMQDHLVVTLRCCDAVSELPTYSACKLRMVAANLGSTLSGM